MGRRIKNHSGRWQQAPETLGRKVGTGNSILREAGGMCEGRITQ